MKISQQVDEIDQRNNLEIETSPEIDPLNQRFPYCIVWTTLPLISCILPFIGHTGICTSDGVIHDFAGPYYIGIDNFAFGRVLKYVRLDNQKINQKQWNDAVLKADQKYEQMMHIICCNNCHSHVANVLNNLNYQNKSNWNMVHVWWMCIWQSKYINIGTFIQTYYLTILFILIIILPILLL